MILMELFSADEKEKVEDDIDWAGDLKFFIDNDDQMLENYIFPAVRRHRKNIGHPNVYKLYIKPIQQCIEAYKEKFEVEKIGEKFPKEIVIGLAKEIAGIQDKFIQDGQYEN